MAGSGSVPPPVGEKRHSLRYYREMEGRNNIGNNNNNNEDYKVKLDDNSNSYSSLANGGSGIRSAPIHTTKANVHLYSPSSPTSPVDGTHGGSGGSLKELRSLGSLGSSGSSNSSSKYIPLSERNNTVNSSSAGDIGLTASRMHVSGQRSSST